MYTVKEAYDRIELCYERMERVESTNGRKYNYKQILEVMEKCPAMNDYWRIRDVNKYVERIVKIKNYKEPKATQEKLLEMCGESFDKRSGEAHAYVLWLEDCGMIKVGKTNNLKNRLRDLSKQYGMVKVLHVFDFSNEEDAYLMEVVLHKYYKKYYSDSVFIPQDRFLGADFNSTDRQLLEESAEKIRLMKWF